jgi:hypothetical protein
MISRRGGCGDVLGGSGRRGRSGVRDGKDDERCELEAAGWRPEERAGETVWQNPESGYWYPQGVAIAMLREGANSGEVPKEPEGGA